MSSTACLHAGICSSCAGYVQYSSSFYDDKKNILINETKMRGLDLPPISISSIGDYDFRDRVDLIYEDGKLGFFEKEKKVIFDLVSCHQFSPALKEWFFEFKIWAKKIKIKKGSVRLRVSPEGKKGAWLDFSNHDVAILLTEKELLQELYKMCSVEVGQRLKKLIIKSDGSLGLSKEREFYPWFETYYGDDLQAFPLYCAIGSFTQPGIVANKVLVKHVLELLKKTPNYPVMELFCGPGNFSFPLASTGRMIDSYEIDEFSLACFRHTLKKHPTLNEHLHLHELNLYKKSGLPDLKRELVLFVDPPRSGLKNVLHYLRATAFEKRPHCLIYVSCFAPSLAQDLLVLTELGYELEDVFGIDQFPQSKHCEWGVLLIKNNMK